METYSTRVCASLCWTRVLHKSSFGMFQIIRYFIHIHQIYVAVCVSACSQLRVQSAVLHDPQFIRRTHHQSAGASAQLFTPNITHQSVRDMQGEIWEACCHFLKHLCQSLSTDIHTVQSVPFNSLIQIAKVSLWSSQGLYWTTSQSVWLLFTKWSRTIKNEHLSL